MFVNNVENLFQCPALEYNIPLSRKHVHLYLERTKTKTFPIHIQNLLSFIEMFLSLCQVLFNFFKLARPRRPTHRQDKFLTKLAIFAMLANVSPAHRSILKPHWLHKRICFLEKLFQSFLKFSHGKAVLLVLDAATPFPRQHFLNHMVQATDNQLKVYSLLDSWPVVLCTMDTVIDFKRTI